MGSTGIANEAVAISNPSATSREIESRKAAMPVGRGTSLQASLDVERAAETTRHSVSTVQPDMAGHAALATQQQSNNIPTSSQPLTDLSLLQLLWLQRQQQAQQHEVHQNDLLLAGPRNNSLRIQSFAEEAQLQALVTAQAHLREQQQCAQLDALRHHLAVPNQGMQPPMLLQMPTHSILAAATLPPPLLQQPPQVVLPLSEYLAYLELVRRGSNP
jgi:hypothetical protein